MDSLRERRFVPPLLAALRLGAVATIGVATTGCGAVDRDSLRAALDRHDLDSARRSIDRALESEGGKDPPRIDGQYGRTLLERAIVDAARDDFRAAGHDLELADRGLGLDDLIRNGRVRMLGTPEAFRYAYLRGWTQALNIPPGLKFYEWLLLNPLAALFRLEAGDATGACVEGRRFGRVAEWTESVAPGRARSVRAFGELATALACDRAGDDALSCAALERAGVTASSLGSARVAARCANAATLPDSELVVIVGYGRVSHPTSAGPNEPVELVDGPETSAADLTITVDGAAAQATEMLDVERALRDDFQESKQAIEITVLGAKARTGDWSIWAWELLPARLSLARAAISPGPHSVTVRVRGTTVTRTVEIAGGTRVMTVLVPW